MELEKLDAWRPLLAEELKKPYFAALADVQAGKAGPIPRQLQNKHYDGEDAAVKGQHYLYPHDYPGSWVDQQYLPDALVGTQYYHWGENKTEQAAKRYWDDIKGKNGNGPAVT